MDMYTEDNSMSFDVVIVGAGPAGLACAIQLQKKAKEKGLNDFQVCLIEKGSEIGAHIISGAVMDPIALTELLPEWKTMNPPVTLEAKKDKTILLNNPDAKIKSIEMPHFFVPKTMLNNGNYVISLGNLTRWLGGIAESLGVNIFTATNAKNVLFDEKNNVIGVETGALGLAKDGAEKSSYVSGYALLGKYTIFAEGCRGHLGKSLIKKFELDKNSDPQHYAIGIKELWEVDNELYEPGLVIHGAGWPLSENNIIGGWWLYHAENNQISLGMFVDLAYKNTYVSPFDEMQRWKHHPEIKKFLKNAKRISYGARAATKGGLNSLPKLIFNGGCLIGDDAGFLNFSKIKGIHTSMKSGMLCADAVVDAILQNRSNDELVEYEYLFKKSWLFKELYRSRNFGPAMHLMGTYVGGAFNFIDQNIFRIPFTLKDSINDYRQLNKKENSIKINYPKPDGVISFDKMSSVFVSNTVHEEDQPCHLKLINAEIPISENLPIYDEPAQRYCPAGVYEIVSNSAGEKKFQINFANCVHCKTCDIKDPAQNINWTPPEGGGGPNYPNM